jgi:hypothetical protein
VHNWCREQRGLRVLLPEPQGRKLYQQRTPAMEAGLTDRIWTIADCPSLSHLSKEGVEIITADYPGMKRGKITTYRGHAPITNSLIRREAGWLRARRCLVGDALNQLPLSRPAFLLPAVEVVVCRVQLQVQRVECRVPICCVRDAGCR